MSKEQGKDKKWEISPLFKKYKTPEEAMKHILITDPSPWGAETGKKKKPKAKTTKKK